MANKGSYVIKSQPNMSPKVGQILTKLAGIYNITGRCLRCSGFFFFFFKVSTGIGITVYVRKSSFIIQVFSYIWQDFLFIFHDIRDKPCHSCPVFPFCYGHLRNRPRASHFIALDKSYIQVNEAFLFFHKNIVTH